MKRVMSLILAAAVYISAPLLGASLQTSNAAPVNQSRSGTGGADTLSSFLKSLPNPTVPPFSETQALGLVAMPLSCADHPQTRSEDNPIGYLFDPNPRFVEGYDKRRAFYGCNDWHSAVNSTWTLVRTLKMFPKMPVAKLIREKLSSHLDAPNIAGEMEFFKDAKGFERPYGYAWLLKLYGELYTWDDPDAKSWSANVASLANVLATRVTTYLKELQFPMRAGVHHNTANCLNLMYDYADAVKDVGFRAVLDDTARRLFLKDQDCPTAYEPSGSDFLSPCLVEAVTMTKALESAEFVKWYDGFMPSPDSVKFKPLTTVYEITTKDDRPLAKSDFINDKVHLIGLAFHRAEALNRIADALPSNDPRVAVYRRLAAIHAQSALSFATDGGYAGSHWVGTYWLLYGVTLRN